MTYIVGYTTLTGIRKYEQFETINHALGFCADIRISESNIYSIIIL